MIVGEDKGDEMQFDDILTKIDLEIKTNEDYNYVKKLLEEKEAKGAKNIKEDQHVREEEIPSNMNMSNLENTFKIEEVNEVQGEN